METIKIEKDSIELQMNINELISFKNSFREVASNLEWEFKIRTGFMIEEVKKIINPIEKAIENGMEEARLQFCTREIIALHQVLNELCNGIRLDNFEQKIGISKQEVREIFDYFKDIKIY